MLASQSTEPFKSSTTTRVPFTGPYQFQNTKTLESLSPYENDLENVNSFACNGVMIYQFERFELEKCFDWLTFEFENYYNDVKVSIQFSGTFDDPCDSGEIHGVSGRHGWTVLPTKNLKVKFKSDKSGNKSGYKLNLDCLMETPESLQGVQMLVGTTNLLSSSGLGNTYGSNEKWAEKVSCKTDEEIYYRFKVLDTQSYNDVLSVNKIGNIELFEKVPDFTERC